MSALDFFFYFWDRASSGFYAYTGLEGFLIVHLNLKEGTFSFSQVHHLNIIKLTHFFENIIIHFNPEAFYFILFLKIYCLIFIVCVSICVGVYACWVQLLRKARGIGFPGTGVTNGFEPPNMGCWNPDLGSLKARHVPNLWAIFAACRAFILKANILMELRSWFRWGLFLSFAFLET